ncbi:hypothetical protein BDY19DRAFT_945644 [Irpex rosettiformis]|uniref:Uncharacterized protein n=1 Tax=Irpex rosettiformis TaxID=378272 RepID=A0ACB8U3D3_9APHY|nr:hypothetical protein BDY19DRAFT_945644 [Irpex rosettiformis]
MMFTRLAVAAASVASLFAGVQAQSNSSSSGLTIYSPGGSDLWWVASSINVVSWTCQTSPFASFSVVLANQDPTKWPALTIISIENNFDCSKTITAEQQAAPAGTGYLVQFVSINNSTDVYATSQPFEIKAAGSVYPATTAVPPGASTSGSAAPTGSSNGSSASTPSSTGTTSHSGGVMTNSAAGLVAAGAAALGLFLA